MGTPAIFIVTCGWGVASAITSDLELVVDKTGLVARCVWFLWKCGSLLSSMSLAFLYYDRYSLCLPTMCSYHSYPKIWDKKLGSLGTKLHHSHFNWLAGTRQCWFVLYCMRTTPTSTNFWKSMAFSFHFLSAEIRCLLSVSSSLSSLAPLALLCSLFNFDFVTASSILNAPLRSLYISLSGYRSCSGDCTTCQGHPTAQSSSHWCAWCMQTKAHVKSTLLMAYAIAT